MYLEKTNEELTALFIENLLDSNRGYSFYVDWTNVELTTEMSLHLHKMDTLIHKNNDEFKSTFTTILRDSKNTLKCFPLLFALSKAERDGYVKRKELKIVSNEVGTENYDVISFNPSKYNNPLTDTEINLIYDIFVRWGLKNVFQNLIEKSTYDYAIGVLVGLDSNGRKNRGGKAFELACEPVIRNICTEHNLLLYTQTTFSELKEIYPSLEVDNSMLERKADFLIVKVNEENEVKCMNIEANFYGAGGSKPEEIINSYKDRNRALTSKGIEFVLLTDGKQCWTGCTNQLKVGMQSFIIMNYKLARDGYLKEVIENVFE